MNSQHDWISQYNRHDWNNRYNRHDWISQHGWHASHADIPGEDTHAEITRLEKSISLLKHELLILMGKLEAQRANESRMFSIINSLYESCDTLVGENVELHEKLKAKSAGKLRSGRKRGAQVDPQPRNEPPARRRAPIVVVKRSCFDRSDDADAQNRADDV